MDIRFVTPASKDFRALAAQLDAYYYTLVGDVQDRYAEPNRPENMDALLVAYHSGQPIGCGAWKRRNEVTAEMKRIYVCPEYRRQGVASSLLQTLEDHSAYCGCTQWILETARDTQDSHKLYLSLGYKEMDYYGSPAGAENCRCFYKER